MNTGNLFFCACFDRVLPCIFLRKSHVVFRGGGTCDVRYQIEGKRILPLYKKIGKIPKFTFAGSFLEGHFLLNERVHSHKIWHIGRKSDFKKIFSAHLRGAMRGF